MSPELTSRKLGAKRRRKPCITAREDTHGSSVRVKAFEPHHTSGTESAQTREFEPHQEHSQGRAINNVEVATKPQSRPLARDFDPAFQETLPPHCLYVEVNCEECGGSGFDPGGIDPWGPEVCPKCHGAKTQTIIRNYLAEAFQIAANPDSTRPIERQHLVAVIQHCREAVSALVSLPDVA